MSCEHANVRNLLADTLHLSLEVRAELYHTLLVAAFREVKRALVRIEVRRERLERRVIDVRHRNVVLFHELVVRRDQHEFVIKITSISEARLHELDVRNKLFHRAG